MQARAIFQAAIEVAAMGGVKKSSSQHNSSSGEPPSVEPSFGKNKQDTTKTDTLKLEIMVPMIASVAEFNAVRKKIDETARAIGREMPDVKLPEYRVGAMIELPRAALCAGALAQTTDFFSFGTNDLTQAVWGLSRDDAGLFLNVYRSEGILQHDPFTTLDDEGVGALMLLACRYARAQNPKFPLGVCGEHGGDPASIQLCENMGLDYLSCSPYRVPIARLAAAQAAIRAHPLEI